MNIISNTQKKMEWCKPFFQAFTIGTCIIPVVLGLMMSSLIIGVGLNILKLPFVLLAVFAFAAWLFDSPDRNYLLPPEQIKPQLNKFIVAFLLSFSVCEIGLFLDSRNTVTIPIYTVVVDVTDTSPRDQLITYLNESIDATSDSIISDIISDIADYDVNGTMRFNDNTDGPIGILRRASTRITLEYKASIAMAIEKMPDVLESDLSKKVRIELYNTNDNTFITSQIVDRSNTTRFKYWKTIIGRTTSINYIPFIKYSPSFTYTRTP